MAEHGWLGPIEWAAAFRPRPGEQVCGDRAVAVAVGESAALFGVVDGLGHGAEAAAAASRGVEVLRGAPAEPIDVLVHRCHRALAATRGAAMTLARIDFATSMLSWLGIGNVDADLVAKHPGGQQVRSSVRLDGGIVGYRLPETLRVQQTPIVPGDLLVIASDGVGSDHLRDIDFAGKAEVIVEQILGTHAQDSDDALVLAARHRGT
ncbi:MAG TPA: SpoIIE family protein phosphatase [Mycobacterium sp.]|nr:SpoIIE family protein phosphatase [Mycobacterium sp.]